MISRCINNDEAKAPKVFQHHEPHPEYVHEDLTVGKDYVVYAMSIFRDDLRFLIQNDVGSAAWKAPYLFETIDSRLPPYWQFASFNVLGDQPWHRKDFQALWGYPVLVATPAHSDRLQDWNAEDVAIFEAEIVHRATYDM